MNDSAIAISQGDYARAINALSLPAEQGDPTAARLLGSLYLAGLGTAKDCNRGERLVQRAAEAGDSRAQYLLGRIYSGGGCGKVDRGRALRWYKKAATAGDPDGAFAVGSLLTENNGVARNLGEAYYWFTRSVRLFQKLGASDLIVENDPRLTNMRAATFNLPIVAGDMTASDVRTATRLLTAGSTASFNLTCRGTSTTSQKFGGQSGEHSSPTTFTETFRIDPETGRYCRGACESAVAAQTVDSHNMTFIDHALDLPSQERAYERIDLETNTYAKRKENRFFETTASAECVRAPFTSFPSRLAELPHQAK